MAEQQSFLSSWQERLTALRNTPPVLKIVWQSGPGVVIFGLVVAPLRFVVAAGPAVDSQADR